jgi:hypothetical protein
MTRPNVRSAARSSCLRPGRAERVPGTGPHAASDGAQNGTICATAARTRIGHCRMQTRHRSEWNPGGVSTSGQLTLRDAQAMTPDLHAQVGWPPPRPAGTGLDSAPRRHAARWPAAVQDPAGPRPSARVSSWRALPRRSRCGIPGSGSGSRGGRSPRLVTDHRAVGKAMGAVIRPVPDTCPEGSPAGTFPLVSARWCHALRSRERRFESCRGHEIEHAADGLLTRLCSLTCIFATGLPTSCRAHAQQAHVQTTDAGHSTGNPAQGAVVASCAQDRSRNPDIWPPSGRSGPPRTRSTGGDQPQPSAKGCRGGRFIRSPSVSRVDKRQRSCATYR